MKRTVYLVAIVSVLGLLSGGRSAAQSTAPAEKTAGEVLKNVQVLKDVPISDFDNTMWFIAGSLGVPCQHCHVNPNDSDAKQAKLTARNMIRMTREINATNFGGRPVVTCNTCHQGSLTPNGVPGFWGKANKTPEQIAAYTKERQPGPPPGQSAPPTQSISPAPAAADPLPSADAVYENYRKAVGTTPISSIHIIAEADPDIGPPIHLEIYEVLPGKIEQTITLPGNQVRQIVDGDRGWAVTPASTVTLSPEQIKNLKGNPILSPFKFSVAEPPRTVTGIEKIGDHSYYVVEWRTAKNRIRLYFDTKTGLLYKSHGDAFTPLGTYPFEGIFDDYREVNGIQFAGSTTSLGTSGGARIKLTEIQINVPVDPKRFEPPPAAAPK